MSNSLAFFFYRSELVWWILFNVASEYIKKNPLEVRNLFHLNYLENILKKWMGRLGPSSYQLSIQHHLLLAHWVQWIEASVFSSRCSSTCPWTRRLASRLLLTPLIALRGWRGESLTLTREGGQRRPQSHRLRFEKVPNVAQTRESDGTRQWQWSRFREPRLNTARDNP